MKVYSPPEFPDVSNKVSIFLGGSIEMGNAENWQKTFIERMDERGYSKREGRYEYIILNPRRPDWDNTLEQSIENPQFFQQVIWELSYLERCSHRVFYFAKDTLSPITLLELGKFHSLGNTYVCFHPEYKRAGNLEIFCNRYNLTVYPDLDSIITKIF